MTTRVVDLNADVVAMRRFRAAAALPQFCALCSILIGMMLFAFGVNGWKPTLVLLGSGGILLVAARGTERGTLWTISLLTAGVLAITVLAAGAIIEAASWVERGQALGGALLLLVPSWILVGLGWKAIPHRAAVSAIHAVSQSAWHRTPRAQRSQEATITFATAVLIYVVGVVPAVLAALAVGGHLWISGIVYAPIAAVAGRMWNRGRRQSALDLHGIRRLDTRPPTILLRSFGDDNLPLDKRYHFFWFFFTAQEMLTLESFVVDQMWRLGPVLAIGNPGERLSPLGAAREYISDDRWRSRIREYLTESRYVVSVLGATPGLSWEYEQLLALGRDQDVLVVFPPRPADELQRRWQVFQSIFGPATGTGLQWDPFIGVPLLAFFAPHEVLVFYCRFRHETAYAAAFSRLFEAIAQGSLARFAS
jgi:hypothetical protein